MTNPWRLGGGSRKAWLVTHIAAAGVWIGLDVALGVLVFTAAFTDDVRTRALCYQAAELFAVWPIVVAAVVSLVSGVVLGLGSRYGLVKYWWVVTKLVLNIALATLVLVLLRPGLADLAAIGRSLPAGGDADGQAVANMFFPPLVSGTALLVAVVLSVYKPWGRTPTRTR